MFRGYDVREKKPWETAWAFLNKSALNGGLGLYTALGTYVRVEI